MDFYAAFKKYGPLAAGLIAAIVLTIVAYKQYKQWQERSRNNPLSKRPASARTDLKNENPASGPESRSEQKAAPYQAHPAQRRFGVITCPHCKIKVLPKSDGTCPNCRERIAAELP